MNYVLIFLLFATAALSIDPQESIRQTKLEDIEKENFVAERRSSSLKNYPKTNTVQTNQKSITNPQLQFGFTPMKDYYFSPNVNSVKNHRIQEPTFKTRHQPQPDQQYQVQFTQQYYQQPQPQQQNYDYEQYQIPQSSYTDSQESKSVEYVQLPQTQALQTSQTVYQTDSGKSDQYSQGNPQYSTLTQQYPATQIDQKSNVVQQNPQYIIQYMTEPQPQPQQQQLENQEVKSYSQFSQYSPSTQYSPSNQYSPSTQYNPSPQNVNSGVKKTTSSKTAQYQQEVQFPTLTSSSPQTTSASGQSNDLSAYQYMQPQLQSLDGSYPSYLTGQKDYLNSFKDFLVYQPQSSASSAVNTYVEPKGPIQYIAYVPSNYIENLPKDNYLQTISNSFHSKPSASSHKEPSRTRTSGKGGARKYVKYTNVAYSPKNIQKEQRPTKTYTQYQNYQNVNSQPRKPTSLLDSYVPSIVQLQYYRELQMKQQQIEEQIRQQQQQQNQESGHESREDLHPPIQNLEYSKSASQKRSPSVTKQNTPKV